MKISNFITETISGKSIYRVVFTGKISAHCSDISGRILDLASGENPSYRKYLPASAEIVLADKNGGNWIDFDEILPFPDSSFDTVLFFNALYITKDPTATLVEVRRVLKSGGKLFISSPFIGPEMPEPHDYQRLTQEGLERVLKDANFSEFKIERFGERFSSAAYLLHPFFLLGIIRLFVNSFSLLLDYFVPANVRKNHPAPLGYFLVAIK